MTRSAALSVTLLAALGAGGSHSDLHSDLHNLSTARVTADDRRGELVIELAPVDLPAGDMALPPVAAAQLPTGGAIYGLRAEVIDEAGHMLPAEFVL